MQSNLKKAADWFENKARELDLKFFDIQFEMVPEEVMLEASTYGLPTRFRHWSFGQSYEYQKNSGEMGMSKLYEVIFNNDPSYAFLLDTNPDFANKMVIAHCFGHCLAGETSVITSLGPKRIDEINVGDVVIDLDGEYRKVLAKVNTKNASKITIITPMAPLGGVSFSTRCTPEHKILIKRQDIDDVLWIEAQYIDLDIDTLAVPKTKILSKDFYNNLALTSHNEEYVFCQIKSVETKTLPQEIPVWDIQVEEGHSFLLENGMIAHNSTFFAENTCFQDTDRKMVYHASERANRIDEYIKQYGIKKVEKIIDIAMSLERNVDLHRGQFRNPYKKRKTSAFKKTFDEFDDLLGGPKLKKPEPETFPPHAEQDILWFLINYSKLSDWEKDILGIIRDESFYFSAIINTKICNEGFASVVHAELMALAPREIVSEEEYLDFVNLHSRVVQPGGDPTNLNPYYLGFTILQDIRKRWDKKFEDGESEIDGWHKVLEVVRNEDDNSLIRNYMTQELVDRMGLFVYSIRTAMDGSQFLEIESRDVEKVINYHIDKSYMNRIPVISITKADQTGMELTHTSSIGTLDIRHMKKVLGYLQEIWGGIINLETIDESKDVVHFSYDEEGFSGDADADTEEV